MTDLEKSRIGLNEHLVNILESRNVYFQPPSNKEMKYPCIVYDFDGVRDLRANDKRYLSFHRWAITVISKNPDSDIWERIVDNSIMCSLDRTAKIDNLYHWYLTIWW